MAPHPLGFKLPLSPTGSGPQIAAIQCAQGPNFQSILSSLELGQFSAPPGAATQPPGPELLENTHSHRSWLSEQSTSNSITESEQAPQGPGAKMVSETQPKILSPQLL